MFKWIIIAVLIVPILEIAAFALVAATIGTAWALILLLATSIAGFAVLRRAGRSRLARFRVVVSDTTELAANTGGVLTVVAGLLLILPGFVTDLAGALLLIGPIRRRFGVALRRTVDRRERPGVIDLDPKEWRQVPDQGAGKPRKRPDRRGRGA